MTVIRALSFREMGGETVYALRAEGHAEGNPPACAGISALLWALAGWVENAPERGCGLTAACRLEPGSADCLLLAETAEARQAARAVWDLTLIGLMQIGKKYPESLRVDIRGGAA